MRNKMIFEGKIHGRQYICIYTGISPYFLEFIYICISACADAYLTPQIKKYVAGFASGFKDNIQVRFFFNKTDFHFAVSQRAKRASQFAF